MERIIHARLDEETEAICRELEDRLGWTSSRVVREGIRTLASLVSSRGTSRIVGQGAFQSGIPDLGSSKRHLEGFGR